MNKHSLGFTLTDLIVCIAVIAIIVALLVPAIQRARDSARRSACKNNLKHIGLALHNYHEVHGSFPAGVRGNVLWSVFILPFMDDEDQDNLYDLIDFSVPTPAINAVNAKIRDHDLPIYRCPSDPGGKDTTGSSCGPSNYTVCVGNSPLRSDKYLAVFDRDKSTRFRDITDGTQNTIMISELMVGSKYANYGNISSPRGILDDCSGKGITGNLRGESWFYGGALIRWGYLTKSLPNTDVACRTFKEFANVSASSMHSGGVHVLMCDGKTRFISENIDLETWRLLGYINDGLIIGEF